MDNSYFIIHGFTYSVHSVYIYIYLYNQPAHMRGHRKIYFLKNENIPLWLRNQRWNDNAVLFSKRNIILSGRNNVRSSRIEEVKSEKRKAARAKPNWKRRYGRKWQQRRKRQQEEKPEICLSERIFGNYKSRFG